MRKNTRAGLAIAIVIVTIAAFGWYIHAHPAVTNQLRHLQLVTAVELLALYTVWWSALVFILQVSVRLFGKKLALRENILLTAYSSLVNFFGPGQSGPGVRALYLKKKHQLPIKKFVLATLLYYAFYAIISAGLMGAGSQVWWKTLILVGAVGGVSLVVVKRYARKSALGGDDTNYAALLGWLFVGTAIQLTAQCAIYFVEIHTIDPQASIGQVITYSGAANFALFVALTPGAIGIREAFLVFTQHLHHIGTSAIVSANVIDRAAYLVFLGLLFIVVLLLHGKQKLQVRSLERERELEG